MSGGQNHPQFHAVLRLDRVLWGWPQHWQRLASEGYGVDEHASGKSVEEVRRFLADWHKRMRPLYMAVSLTDSFQFPDDSITSKLLSEAALPSCREFGIPMSLMIGVRRQVNPRLRLAGDAVGKADMRAVENLCRTFPDNRFLVSVLSRENQHELAVYARKFNNLMPFGCWWFLNNPSKSPGSASNSWEPALFLNIPMHAFWNKSFISGKTRGARSRRSFQMPINCFTRTAAKSRAKQSRET